MRGKKEPNDDLIGDITKEYNLDDEIKHNPGFGKPLPSRLFKGDVYANFLNTAREQGFRPPFVELQKEIKAGIENVLALMENEDDRGKLDLEKAIDVINAKVRKYNLACPPKMQKRLLQLETLKAQAKLWE